jgi:putative flippase GtrA
MENKLSFKKIQFLRYVIVGGLSSMIYMFVGYMYLYYVEYSLFLSNILAFFVAFIYSYSCQTLYVFKRKINLINLAKYFIVQLILFIATVLIIDNISIYNYYIKTVFVLIIIAPTSFLLNKFWTFN